MTVHLLRDAPPAPLAEALSRFEGQFRYPLGPGRWFRIAHDADYSRFFRAIGDGVVCVAERDGEVRGTLGLAIRPLRFPDGTTRPVAYLADLKVAPGLVAGRVLRALAAHALAIAQPRVTAAFAVVMGGTARTPEAYTGRLGLPALAAVGQVTVLRLLGGRLPVPADADPWVADAAAATAARARLAGAGFVCPPGDAAARSAMAPLALVAPDGRATGILEDTRRAKRLIGDDGSELLSAHVSGLSYGDPAAGATCVAVAHAHAGRLGCPATFVAVPATVAAAFRTALAARVPGVTLVEAPAVVYGTGCPSGHDWHVNTAEV